MRNQNVVGLVVLYNISTIEGYLMSDPVYIYILLYSGSYMVTSGIAEV